MRAVAVPALCILTLVQPLTAQVRSLADADLPRGVAEELQAVIDNPSTRRYDGAAAIGADETVPSSVVTFDGPLTIAGRVDGDVIVISGDLAFDPGAVVAGNVTVVGGSMRGADEAKIGGTVTVYDEGFSLYRRGERLIGTPRRWHDGGRDDWDDDDRSRWNRTGRSEFVVRIPENYNRVEGLPLAFGPDIWTSGRSPFRVQALAIWRTATGSLFDTEDMGYIVRAEQFLGTRDLRVGASLRSTVQPIEDWPLSDLEASLAAALFHEDYRDYFERQGWSAYARLAPRGSPLDLTVEYRDEEHGTLPVRDPWTLFDGDDLWRPQPLVAEGSVRLLSGSAEIDARRGADFHTSGWLLRGTVHHRLDGDLVVPAAVPGARQVSFDQTFTTALVDLRRYQRIGWNAVLALRGVAGGNTREQPLPPQFQHALGGAGSMPGYPAFSADCGARRALIDHTLSGRGTESFFPAYGCDRFALVQAEYRGGFDFRFRGHDPRDDDDWDWHVDTSLNWIVFFDAGRGWAYDAAGITDTRALYDVGAGVILGGFGIYGAMPLNGDDRSVNLFVRLGPRF